MKKRISAFLLAAALLGAAALPATARETTEESRDRRHGITLELWGGYARLAPRDLNLQADYDNAYVDYFYRQRYVYQTATGRGFFSCSGAVPTPNSFASLSRTAPFGFRAKISLNRALSLSLGVTSLARTVTSDCAAVYNIRNLNPDKVEFNDSFEQRMEYPRLQLAVRGWTPMAAIHARTRLARRLVLEGHAGAGIVFASFTALRERSFKTTEADGYWEINSYREEMRGSGRGVALEAGAQVSLPLSARFDVFIEGSYAYRAATKVTGSYSYRQRHEELNADPYDIQSTFDGGIWRVSGGTYNNPWGRWNASWPALRNPGQIENSDPFHLDLSGIQVKIGIAWRL